MHPGQRQRVFVPVCPPCNAILNTRFELPARPILRQVLTQGWSVGFTTAEWRTVGLWYAKILLMLGHPEAAYSNDTISAGIVVRWATGSPDISWLFKGADPPGDLSLWVFNASLTPAQPSHGVVVPRVVHTPGADPVTFHFIKVVDVNGPCLTLLSHPGWPVKHPLVDQGQAWELLRDPPSSGNLSLLPQLSDDVIAWHAYDMTLASGFRLGAGLLPPLRAGDPSPFPPPEVRDVLTDAQPVPAP